MGIKAKEGILNVFIFLGAIALLFVVGYPQYKESLPSKVKIGVDDTYASLPFYLAQRDTSRQYFKLSKVEPDFVPISGDPLKGLKNGQYDVVAVPWYSLMISPTINGDTIRAFGSIEIESGKSLDAIIIPEKSKIKKFKDLSGKKLGYLQQDEYLVNLILQKLEQENIKEVEKVMLRPSELDNAFANKKVDVLFLLDPYRGYMLYQGHNSLQEGVVSQYLIPSLPYAAIVMRENYVKNENRLAAIRVKDAIEATLSYINRNPDVARRFMIKHQKWPSEGELVHKMRTPEYQRLAEVDMKGIERFQTELVKLGIGTCGIRNPLMRDRTLH
jgi:ABC-type nitrate/sulfonate/bicarbonate transport system substrate-binding protein